MITITWSTGKYHSSVFQFHGAQTPLAKLKRKQNAGIAGCIRRGTAEPQPGSQWRMGWWGDHGASRVLLMAGRALGHWDTLPRQLLSLKGLGHPSVTQHSGAQWHQLGQQLALGDQSTSLLLLTWLWGSCQPVLSLETQCISLNSTAFDYFWEQAAMLLLVTTPVLWCSCWSQACRQVGLQSCSD